MGLLDFILIFIVVFFLSIGFLLLRQKQTEWLHSCSEKLGTLCFPAVFIAVLVTLTVGVFYLGHNMTWLDINSGKGQWDYLNALATIIGAGISLIPIFWLIGQNKLIHAQLDLQYKQNNADMFQRACSMLGSEEVGERKSGLLILGDLIDLENCKYNYIIKQRLRSLSSDDKCGFSRFIIETLLSNSSEYMLTFNLNKGYNFNIDNKITLYTFLILALFYDNGLPNQKSADLMKNEVKFFFKEVRQHNEEKNPCEEYRKYIEDKFISIVQDLRKDNSDSSLELYICVENVLRSLAESE